MHGILSKNKEQGMAEGINPNELLGSVYDSKNRYLGTWNGQRLVIDPSVWKKWKDENGQDWASGMVGMAKDRIASGVWTVQQPEGVAEESKYSNLSNRGVNRGINRAADDFNRMLDLDQAESPHYKTQHQQDTKQRLKTKPMAGPKGMLPEQGVAEGQLDEIGDTPAGQAALQRYGNKAHDQVAAHWKQVHNKSHLPTDTKMAKRNSGTVAADNRIHGFGIAKNQQDKVTDRFKYRDAVGTTHVYQKNDPLEQGVGEGIVPKPYMPPGLASATTPPSDNTSRGWKGHEWDPEQDNNVEHLTFQTRMQTTEKPGMKPTTTYDTQNTSSKTGITSTHEVDVDEGLSRLRELAGVQGMAEADRPGLPPKLNPHGMSQAQIDDRMTSVGFIPGTRDHATAVQLYRAANPNTARPVSKPLPRSHIQGTDVGPLPLPRSDIQGTDVGPLPLSPLGRGQDNPHSPVTNVDLTPQRDEFSPNPDIGPHSQPFSVDIRGYGPEPDEFGRQHNGSHESEIEMEEGSVEKTPTGLKHHGDLPGYPREKGKEFNHNIDRLNKSETGKLDKAFGVNWNRGPNRQVTGDSTGVTEGQADLNTIKRLLGK